MHWNRVAVAGTSSWVATHEKPRRGGGILAVGGAGAVGAIGGIIKDLGGIPFIVGGMPDHVHLLITLPKNMTLVDLARITKAKSSRWIKTISSDYCTFAWQDGYGAFSVSPSILEKTVDYIKNQERHHQKKSYQDEYKAFLEAYKIPYDEKYIFND